MTMTAREIKAWLNTLDDTDDVGIDDGGLTLRVIQDPFPYLEIGGMPEQTEAESEA